MGEVLEGFKVIRECFKGFQVGLRGCQERLGEFKRVSNGFHECFGNFYVRLRGLKKFRKRSVAFRSFQRLHKRFEQILGLS